MSVAPVDALAALGIALLKNHKETQTEAVDGNRGVGGAVVYRPGSCAEADWTKQSTRTDGSSRWGRYGIEVQTEG